MMIGDLKHHDVFSYQGILLHHEMLDKYTTWRVGGKAKVLYKPKSIDDLQGFLASISLDEKIFFLGLGSNSLISDEGISGIVIVTQGGLNQMKLINDEEIYVEAGVSCASLARFAARSNLAGGEFWAGIPGTLGGALRMNAGCFDGDTWTYVQSVQTINRHGEIKHRSRHEFDISYRHVKGLSTDEFFVSAHLKLKKGDKARALKTIKELLERRAQTQPTSEYNCGSVFRNPEGHYAAALIESCGLKGFQMGGAKISEKHANFIINHNGHASAHDIRQLIVHVQTVVKDKTGINLIREVHFLGEIGEQ